MASQDSQGLAATSTDFSFPHAHGWLFLHGSSQHQDHNKKTNTLSDTFWESKHSCLHLMDILGLKLRLRFLPKQPLWGSCCFFSWDAETLSISSLPLLLLILPDFLEKTSIAWLRGRIILCPSQKGSRACKELVRHGLLSQAMGIRLAKLCHVPRRKHRQEKKQQHQESEAKTAGLWSTEVSSKKLQSQTWKSLSHVHRRRNLQHYAGRGCVASGQADQCGQGIKTMPRSKVKAATLSDAHNISSTTPTSLLHML